MNNLSPRRDEDVVLVLLSTPKHTYLRPLYNVGITSRENGRPSKLAKRTLGVVLRIKPSIFSSQDVLN